MGKKRNSCYTVDQASSYYSKLSPLASVSTYRDSEIKCQSKDYFQKIQLENIPDLNNKNFNLLSNSHGEIKVPNLISFIILSFV